MWIEQSQGLQLEEGRAKADAHLERLRRGDNEAWEQLVHNSEARLYSYLLYNLPTPEDAQDLLNEIFLAALHSLPSTDEDFVLLKWLYTIARRKVADFWRRTRPTDELSETLEATPNQVSLEFREALNMLPEQARQALLLRYREGLSVAEVAEVLGRSYKATESLLSRGRVMLKAALEDGGIE
jgi:RNA polymerase sigma-70 factor, ECF subfamily